MIEIIALIVLITIGYLLYFHPYKLRKYEKELTIAGIVISILTIIAFLMLMSNSLLKELAHKVLPFI